jgi:HSP20 family molecular chaperone IbpA
MGKLTRSNTLHSSMDPKQVSAHCGMGVLRINLPKRAEAEPTHNKVSVGGGKTLEAHACGRPRKTSS